LRALILDDDPALSRLHARLAEEVGFTACTIHTASQFAIEFSNCVPELIMLDLHLGDSDGVEVLRFLSDAGYAGPIVLVSGADPRVLRASGRLGGEMNLNIAGIVSKPARIAELREILLAAYAALEPLGLERLLAGIAADELVLEFQPIVQASSRLPVALEALVRWSHPTLGRISPDRFIPVAERDGDCMAKLTDWVILNAAMASAALEAAGFSLPIAINVSTLNIRDLEFPERFQRLTRSVRVEPSRLSVEITETAAFGDPVHSNEVLTRLRLKGVELAIDDFGTGYSSLASLKQLPFSVLKIDRSFVSDLTTSPDSYAIAKSVADLARNMGLATVAEGVENEDTARILTDFGVDNLQGYLFSRPLPLAQIVIRLRNTVRTSSLTTS
jgi:EAL domain-containing protein (putative c-di-GMP-specific phosphodiesterase class I)